MGSKHLSSIVTAVPAPLSVLGSFAIIHVISKSKDKLHTTLNRLLIGLCIGDLLASIPMAFSTAIINYEERSLADDNGEMIFYQIPVATNQAACHTQGFFIVLGGILSPFYNCALCLYYVCVVKWNYSDAKITRNIEPFLHAIPWLWALRSAIIASATNSIHPFHGMCFMHPTPSDCNTVDSIECEEGQNAEQIRFVSHTFPMLVIFFAICIQMTVVYLHVRRQERRLVNAGFRSANVAQAASGGRRRSSIETSMIAGRQSLAQANASRGVLRQTVSNSRKVLNQALAYVGAYFCTYFFIFLLEFISLVSGESNATISLIAAFLYPLQGFFNFVVFIFSRVSSQLRGNGDMNILQALWAAIQCKPIPPRRRSVFTVGGARESDHRPRTIGNGLRGTANVYDRSVKGNDANRIGLVPATDMIAPMITSSMSGLPPPSLYHLDSNQMSSGGRCSDAVSGSLVADSDDRFISSSSVLPKATATLSSSSDNVNLGISPPCSGSMLIKPIIEIPTLVHIGEMNGKLGDGEKSGQDIKSIALGEQSCSMDNRKDEEIGVVLKDTD